MFNNIYKDKKILITGNTGFKGSWLSIWLTMLQAKVYGFSLNNPSDPSMFQVLKLENKINHVVGDVRDLQLCSELIEKIKPDFIFHLAAQALVSISYSDPIDTISTNVIGTMNILEALRKSNHRCNCVIITSDKCYDNVEWLWGYKETDILGGKDIYSGSKGAAELIFKSYYHSYFNNNQSKVKIATARAGNVIGGGDWAKDRIIPDCIRSWSKNEAVNIRSPRATRPWQHVLEPLSGYLLLGSYLSKNKHLSGESFNFGPVSNNNYSVEVIIREFSKHWKFSSPEQAYKIIDEIKFHEAGLLRLNCDKAFTKLKWSPTLHFAELIEFTSSWYYKFYNDEKDMYDYTVNQIYKYEKLAGEKHLKWTR